jgi:hypothetical protein
VSVTGATRSAGFVRVQYRPGILLMMPVPATSLRPAAPRGIPTKLCREALEDLVAVAGESEGACPSGPATSGEACRQNSAGTSSTTSRRSSGR